MALISIYKVVSSVPASLDANAVYLVRTGTGFDLYVSDSTGSIAYQINSSGEVVDDTTPQLGGDLDLNGNDIVGTGNISITGEIEADIHIGSLRGEIQFKAKAGEALTKGDPVYISSYDTVGNTPIVSIADANDSSKMPCFGLANESVSLNASVNVVTFGTLSGLDTSGFSLGDTLYISTTGTLTNSKPSGESSLIQNIGKIQRVDNSAGAIKVGGAGRTNDVPNLNQGNVFIGNASNQAETRGLTLDDIAETETNKHFTSGDKTKLNGIESGATADQTAGEIKTAYESNADTNAFTDSEKSKLSAIEPDATADQTGSEIKALYEAEANTNAYTDTEKTKLSGIEASADVTDTANVTAAGALMDSELTSEASVKALDQGVATTDSPSFAGLTVSGDISVSGGTIELDGNHPVGVYNVALGSGAMGNTLSVSSSNTAVGHNALGSNTSNYSTAFGAYALGSSTTGGYNTAVGPYALGSSTTATDNTAVGAYALGSCTTGNFNTAFGEAALYNCTTATDNTAVGLSSGSAITTGSKNTILGRYSGNQGGVDIRTSDNNVVLSDGDGNPRLHIDASGNAYFDGTVDGRDLSADGTKLDGIEANATADQTGAEIKAAYEAEANTNAFTDVEKTKLSNIEANATADQTADEILTSIKTVDGDGSGLDADTLDGVQGSAFVQSNTDATFSGVTISTPSTPSSRTATGTQGQLAYDDYFSYICTSTNRWKRSPLFETLFEALFEPKTFPTTILNGLVLWHELADAWEVETVSGAVSEVRDLSGNEFHATQTTVSRRPSFASNVADFDGSNDYLILPTNAITALQSTSQTTTFIVCEPLVGGVIFGISDTNHPSREHIITRYLGNIELMHRNGTSGLSGNSGLVTSIPTTNKPILIIYRANGSSTLLSVRGGGVTNSNTYSTTSVSWDACAGANECKYGMNEDNGGVQWPYEGKIYESMVFNMGLSDVMMETVADYFKNKYDVDW